MIRVVGGTYHDVTAKNSKALIKQLDPSHEGDCGGSKKYPSSIYVSKGLLE